MKRISIYRFIDVLIYRSMEHGVRHVGDRPHARPLRGSADFWNLRVRDNVHVHNTDLFLKFEGYTKCTCP